MSGSSLAEMFPDKLEELMLKVRARLAAGSFKRETTSYWLLLALDLANKNWQNFPEPLATFYAARLGKTSVLQLQAGVVATTPTVAPGSRAPPRSASSSGVAGGGGRNKEYWQHDDRVNEAGAKEHKVPQGRPLHGTGRSKGSKEKELPQDETSWD